MKKTSRSHHGSMNELNITPLLDLAFVLLVIFIITTPQMVNNLEMNLPSAKVPPPKDRPAEKPHQILVTQTGQVSLDGTFFTLDQLRGRIQSVHQGNPEAAFVIRGARDTDYQHVIRVLDILQQLEITKLGLATEVGG